MVGGRVFHSQWSQYVVLDIVGIRLTREAHQNFSGEREAQI